MADTERRPAFAVRASRTIPRILRERGRTLVQEFQKQLGVICIKPQVAHEVACRVGRELIAMD
jgi:hypothetical protein